MNAGLRSSKQGGRAQRGVEGVCQRLLQTAGAAREPGHVAMATLQGHHREGVSAHVPGRTGHAAEHVDVIGKTLTPGCFTVGQRLGLHFDVYSGESCHRDQAQEVVRQLRSRGLLKTSEYVTSHGSFWDQLASH